MSPGTYVQVLLSSNGSHILAFISHLQGLLKQARLQSKCFSPVGLEWDVYHGSPVKKNRQDTNMDVNIYAYILSLYV